MESFGLGSNDPEKHVVFRVGPTLCAIPSLQVEHMSEAPPRFTRIPAAPPGVVGILEYRSEVALAVCLHRKFGLRTVRSAGTGVVLLGRLDGSAVGLWVDEVLDVVTAPRSEWIPMPSALPDTLFHGLILHDDRLILMTDVERLCRVPCAKPGSLIMEGTTDDAAEEGDTVEEDAAADEDDVADEVDRESSVPASVLAVADGSTASASAGALSSETDSVASAEASSSRSTSGKIRAKATPSENGGASRNSDPRVADPRQVLPLGEPTVENRIWTKRTVSGPSELDRAGGEVESGWGENPADLDAAGGSHGAASSRNRVGKWITGDESDDDWTTDNDESTTVEDARNDDWRNTGDSTTIDDGLAGNDQSTTPDHKAASDDQRAADRVGTTDVHGTPDQAECGALAGRVRRDADSEVIESRSSTRTDPESGVIDDSSGRRTRNFRRLVGAAIAALLFLGGVSIFSSWGEDDEGPPGMDSPAAAAVGGRPSRADRPVPPDPVPTEEPARRPLEEPARPPLEEPALLPTDRPVQRESRLPVTIVVDVRRGGSEPSENGLAGAVPAQVLVHVVVSGDTLWDICESYLGDPFQYPQIAELSRIVDPHWIYPGDTVRLIIR